MMCADFMDLRSELRLFEREGYEYLHVDIMDGHYVPNFTLGPAFCEKLAAETTIPLDIHLMIEPVDSYVDAFAAFPGAIVTFHPEATRHPLRTIDAIRARGARPGVAVEPAVPVAAIEPVLEAVDFVCVMTVNPGFSGQMLVPGAIEKIARFATWRGGASSDDVGPDARAHRTVAGRPSAGRQLEIEVDGNVSWENIPKMIAAGADTLVVGTSSLFGDKGNRSEAASRLARLTGRR